MSPAKRPPASASLLAIGSYTPVTGGHGIGISVVNVDQDGRNFCIVSETLGDSPSFVLWHAPTRTLYAANETTAGALSAYRVTTENTLDLISTRPSGGGRPCHIAIHPSGRWLAVSNYAGGTFTAVTLGQDGTLGTTTSIIEHQGHGIHPTRQNQPHPHAVIFTSDGRWALLLDVGLDTISVHACDSHTLSAEPIDVVSCLPGSGPRHGIWLSDSVLAVVEEISGTVSLFAWNGSGELVGPTETVSSTALSSSDGWPSEIQRVSSDTIIVGNRTSGLLATLSLTGVGHLLAVTREFTLPSPNVRHFWASTKIAFVALQDSDQLISIDLLSGIEADSLAIANPAFVAAIL